MPLIHKGNSAIRIVATLPKLLLGLFPGGGVLPYIGYTAMCRWKGYGFQAFWSHTSGSNCDPQDLILSSVLLSSPPLLLWLNRLKELKASMKIFLHTIFKIVYLNQVFIEKVAGKLLSRSLTNQGFPLNKKRS